MRNDFIELFNRGDTTVELNGWSVQYATTTGATWQVTNLSGSLAPGQYYLVQQAAGAGGTTQLPTPDAVGSINLAATAGKVALVNNTTALAGACPSGAALADLVGYGGGANCAEGTPAPAPSNTNAVLRKSDGCADTGNNAADFMTGAPAPRNRSSPSKTCAGGATVVSPEFLFGFGRDGPSRVFLAYLMRDVLNERRR